jgi:hypothetical protein
MLFAIIIVNDLEIYRISSRCELILMIAVCAQMTTPVSILLIILTNEY